MRVDSASSAKYLPAPSTINFVSWLASHKSLVFDCVALPGWTSTCFSRISAIATSALATEVKSYAIVGRGQSLTFWWTRYWIVFAAMTTILKAVGQDRPWTHALDVIGLFTVELWLWVCDLPKTTNLWRVALTMANYLVGPQTGHTMQPASAGETASPWDARLRHPKSRAHHCQQLEHCRGYSKNVIFWRRVIKGKYLLNPAFKAFLFSY